MVEFWNFYLLRVVLQPQNSSVYFMGLSGLPMKVKFLVSLMFLFSVPKHQADLKEVLYCCERSSCSFSVFLSWCFSLSTEADQATCTVCTNRFQTALVRDRHLSYFTRSASWNPRLDLHPGKLLNLWRLNFPPFWSPVPVFCAVYESWNTAAVFFCQPPLCVTNPPPANAQIILQVIPGWAPCISPCCKPVPI